VAGVVGAFLIRQREALHHPSVPATIEKLDPVVAVVVQHPPQASGEGTVEVVVDNDGRVLGHANALHGLRELVSGDSTGAEWRARWRVLEPGVDGEYDSGKVPEGEPFVARTNRDYFRGVAPVPEPLTVNERLTYPVGTCNVTRHEHSSVGASRGLG
jgi:hypothetical protein